MVALTGTQLQKSSRRVLTLSVRDVLSTIGDRVVSENSIRLNLTADRSAGRPGAAIMLLRL